MMRFLTWNLIHRLQFIFFVAACLTFLSSCQSRGHRIEDVDRSVLDLRRVIESAMGDSVEISKNGRVFRSKTQSRSGSGEDGGEYSERFYDVVTVLGDRRPYRILVQSMSQSRLANGYSAFRYDSKRSRDFGLVIQMKLSQSRGDKNFIDDFRPF
ncbi:MAG: hypothetical protein WCH11_01620 [Bdellovibrio sp.]